AVIVLPLQGIGCVLEWIDVYIIDGVVKLITFAAFALGKLGLRLQNGQVASYGLMTLLGFVILVIALLGSRFILFGYFTDFKHDLITIPLNKEMEGMNQLKSFSLKFDYSLAIDGLSLPLIFLTALIFSMAALASVYIKKRWKIYFILFLLLEIGVLGVFMAQD